MRTSSTGRLATLILAWGAIVIAGCKTGGQTGALAGGGIGALAGQAIGGDTESTLIGAAVGTGIGYIIGNEADKKHAKPMSQSSSTTTSAPHSETGALGRTRWQLVSLNPRDIVPPYASRVIEFTSTGRAITTTTKPDGSVETHDESFRVVGDTLIINKPGYLINARHRVSGSELVVSAEEFSAVLRRM
jgi:hypothetical protein